MPPAPHPSGASVRPGRGDGKPSRPPANFFSWNVREKPIVLERIVFTSRYVSCDDCGASVARDESGRHECDPERRLDFVIFQLRDEVARLDVELGAYLDSPNGRFESWYAEHQRLADHGET